MRPFKKNLIKTKVKYNWYIAACLFNNEKIFGNWAQQLLLLINELKSTNIFVSIIENGDSMDNTRLQLETFKIKLDETNIQNTIITKTIVNKSYHRFRFLSEIRNKALESLYNLNWNSDETRVIFLNDIYYKMSDVINLINTNNMEYDFACGLDFFYAFYDVLVSRDLGMNILMDYYPYFKNSTDQKLVRNGLPIRVFSCWNGMVIMKATPFVEHKVRFRDPKQNESMESECYFICKDFWRLGFNHIYINPNVKVAYLPIFYYVHNYFMSPVNIFTDWYYWFRGY
jgi:hypothetical protein